MKFLGLLLKRYFWQVAKSYDHTDYNEAMKMIKDSSFGKGRKKKGHTMKHMKSCQNMLKFW